MVLKRTLPLFLWLLMACSQQVTTLSVLDYGAVPGQECTEALQAALDAAAPGSRVLIPEGTFRSATLYLRPGVELHLEKGAVLQGVQDPEAYAPYIPQTDLSRFDSGGGTANANCVNDRQWMKAFLIGHEADGASITGEGTIDGSHVMNPMGEEGMRGPHTIVLAETRRFSMVGITITRAANYAFLGYALESPVFEGLTITEGWDGIHIRGASDAIIRDCRFQTGDDAIAGGYWENMLIERCDINSSCNGIRMIMPSDGLEVRRCVLHGPGAYPHRTSGEARRNNMLFGIALEPGAWGTATGTARGIYLHDLTFKDLSAPVATSVREGSIAQDLTLEHITATGLTGALVPIVSWNDQGFREIRVKDCHLAR